MITKGDDYPIHQTSDPIAYSGTDRNFYDRYYFNGYSHDGSIFFACAFGVYPHVNIMDGAFCVVSDGVQHNLRMSRHLNMERMDTVVKPLKIEVIEPLQRLRIRVEPNEHGIEADLLFHARALPVEEPRFTYRVGPRSFMDYTRLTQNGSYDGWINVQGKRVEVTNTRFWGTRDRSWGVRPIGLPDPQEAVPPLLKQFFWLWAPLNFEDCFTLYHLNADERGYAWNTAGVFGLIGETEPEHIKDCRSEVTLVSGTRHAMSASIFFSHRTGGETRIDLKPQWKFYMSGLGYFHPEWVHGMNKGPLAVGYDSLRTAEIDSFTFPLYLHVQQFVEADMKKPDGSTRQGCGVLEQLILGPYEPIGLKGLLDPAS
jgi:hypothetical protein